MHDPAIPLNCPYCGVRVEHQRVEGESLFYTCPRHGVLVLPPDGRLRMVLSESNRMPARGSAGPN